MSGGLDARRVLRALKGAVSTWFDRRLARRAAGLAFYTAFSLAPMLLVLTLVADALFHTSDVEVLRQVLHILPGSSVDAVQVLVDGLKQRRGSGTAAIAGGVGLVFGATGVFMALQDALDDVWGTPADARGGAVLGFILRRLLSFAMLMALGFLLLVSLVLNAMLTFLIARLGPLLTGGEALWQSLNVLLALGMTTGVFTLLFRFVPTTRVSWRSSLVGAVVTALLFQLGQGLMAWYLGDAARLSIYGVFGSLIVLLLWVYYAAQILLFGAAVARNDAGAAPGPAE